MSVGIFVLAQPLNSVLRLYPPSAAALQILALALGFAFVNNAFIGALNASDRQLSFTWAAGWSLAANLALNLALTRDRDPDAPRHLGQVVILDPE